MGFLFLLILTTAFFITFLLSETVPSGQCYLNFHIGLIAQCTMCLFVCLKQTPPLYVFKILLPLDEVIVSRAVFGVIYGSDGRADGNAFGAAK